MQGERRWRPFYVMVTLQGYHCYSLFTFFCRSNDQSHQTGLEKWFIKNTRRYWRNIWSQVQSEVKGTGAGSLILIWLSGGGGAAAVPVTKTSSYIQRKPAADCQPEDWAKTVVLCTAGYVTKSVVHYSKIHLESYVVFRILELQRQLSAHNTHLSKWQTNHIIHFLFTPCMQTR